MSSSSTKPSPRSYPTAAVHGPLPPSCPPSTARERTPVQASNSRSELTKKEKLENEEILGVKTHLREHQDRPKGDAAEGREQAAEPHATPPAHPGYSDRAPGDDEPRSPLLKLHAALEQEHHGVQQLALETARQEPSREGGGAK